MIGAFRLLPKCHQRPMNLTDLTSNDNFAHLDDYTINLENVISGIRFILLSRN